MHLETGDRAARQHIWRPRRRTRGRFRREPGARLQPPTLGAGGGHLKLGWSPSCKEPVGHSGLWGLTGQPFGRVDALEGVGLCSPCTTLGLWPPDVLKLQLNHPVLVPRVSSACWLEEPVAGRFGFMQRTAIAPGAVLCPN